MANAVKNLGVGVMRNSVCTALPKISVIMTCYNSEKFVGKSIQSVIDQTYSNWELLCVNDMSTDNTLDVLQQYAAKDSRIKVFDKKVRGGMGAPNFNYAIEYATGDFMCLLGHDDKFSPDLLGQEVKRWLETGADIIIPDCMFVYPDDPEKKLGHCRYFGLLGEIK